MVSQGWRWIQGPRQSIPAPISNRRVVATGMDSFRHHIVWLLSSFCGWIDAETVPSRVRKRSTHIDVCEDMQPFLLEFSRRFHESTGHTHVIAHEGEIEEKQLAQQKPDSEFAYIETQ